MEENNKKRIFVIKYNGGGFYESDENISSWHPKIFHRYRDALKVEQKLNQKHKNTFHKDRYGWDYPDHFHVQEVVGNNESVYWNRIYPHQLIKGMPAWMPYSERIKLLDIMQ